MLNQKPQNFDCATAVERLHEFLDGELQDELMVAMERHLRECAECTKVLHQFRYLEAAHPLLDAKIEMPPEEFWQALPARVMQRVKASERRRLLALRRLPRFRPASIPARAAGKQAAGSILHLLSRVQAFINGPGKYAVALAAVAVFCFVMIREFTKQPLPVTTAYKAAGREVASPEPEVEETKPGAITPASESKKPEPPPSTIQPNKLLTNAPPQIDLLGKQAAVSGQGAMLAATAESSSTERSSQAPTTVESKPAEGRGEQVAGLAEGGQSVALQKELAYNLTSQSADRAESKQKQGGEGELAEQSLSALTAQKDKKTAPVKTSAKQAAEASPFSQTLWQAQHTADLKEREKIWRAFLAATPDSTYQHLAIYHLAQTLASASDSSSTAAALEQNLTFFIENARIIRPQMGAIEFARELARLHGLFKWRQAAAVEKP